MLGNITQKRGISIVCVRIGNRGDDGLVVCAEKNRHTARLAGVHEEIIDARLLIDPDGPHPAEAVSLLVDLQKAFVLLFCHLTLLPLPLR